MRKSPSERVWTTSFKVIVIIWVVLSLSAWIVTFTFVPVNLRPAFIGAASGVTFGGGTGLLSTYTARRGVMLGAVHRRRTAYAEYMIAADQYRRYWNAVVFDAALRTNSSDAKKREIAAMIEVQQRDLAEPASIRLAAAVRAVETDGSEPAIAEVIRLKSVLPTDREPSTRIAEEVLQEFERIKKGELDQ
jgi:hypothetical protein